MGGDFWREFGLAALGASAVVGSGLLSIWAIRRDRREDKHAQLEEKVNRNGNRLTHVEGYLSARGNFRPYD